MGTRIRRARKARGLTQTQLGELMHAEQSTIWRWETGESSVPSRRMRELANVLSVPGDFFTLSPVTEDGLQALLKDNSPKPARKARRKAAGPQASDNGGSAPKPGAGGKAAVRQVPVLTPEALVSVSLGEMEPENCDASGNVWHDHEGRVLATYHEGPPFGKIQSGYILLVRLDTELINDGRLYVINRDGRPQIRRARVEGERPTVSLKETIGELMEVRIMPGIL